MRESEKLKKEMMDENDELPLEKNDMTALVLSGFLTIGLPSLVAVLIILGVTWLIFGG
ncbi:MAG: hypothetical protein J5589_00360 [Firmicutes bacterium]|nr:hypothetical protein [Bacillota bacterium]